MRPQSPPATLYGLRDGEHVPCAIRRPLVAEMLVMNHGNPANSIRSMPATCRRGFSLLEFMVAMLLFGLTITGLFPLVVMYSRTVQSLEQRPNALARRAGGWVHQSYFVPATNPSSPYSAHGRANSVLLPR